MFICAMCHASFRVLVAAVTISVFSCCLDEVRAQVSERDSLLRLLTQYPEDTNRVQTYFYLARYYEKNNLDSATYYLQLLKELSDKLSYERGHYRYYERMAVVSFTNGLHNKALEESKEGLRLARRLKHAGYEAAMLNMIAICYQYLGRHDEQLDYVLQAQAKAEEVKDTMKIAGMYSNLSIAYSSLGQYRKSIDAGLAGIRFREQHHADPGYINRLYLSVARGYDYLNISDSAIYYYDKALTSSQRLVDRFAEASIYRYLTNLYAFLGKYDKMREKAELALRLAKQVNSKQLQATAYNNLAAASYYTNNNAKALEYVNQALSIAEADTIRHEMQSALRLLSYIAAGKGDFVTSVQAQRRADSLQQAALNEEVSRSAADLEKKYETEKKLAQIKLQQAAIRQKNLLNYIFLASAIVAIILALLIFWIYRKKQQLQQQRINELETEKQLMATQALVKGQEDERSRMAKDLHDGLGGLLSGVKLQLGAMKGNLILSKENGRSFNLALQKLDESINEMRRVAHNMMPEALLNLGLGQALQDYCDGLSEGQPFTIFREFYGLEERMEPSVEIVLYRIVQELLNNAVKHSGASEIVAQVIRKGDQISITVEDNGKGFELKNETEMHSAGLRNIRSRVHYLHGQLDIQSQPGKGTSIHIDCLIKPNGQNG